MVAGAAPPGNVVGHIHTGYLYSVVAAMGLKPRSMISPHGLDSRRGICGKGNQCSARRGIPTAQESTEQARSEYVAA